jgi:hypothetical protein
MKKMANGLSTCCLTIAPRDSTFQSHRPEVNIRVSRNKCKIGSGILFDALTAIQFDSDKNHLSCSRAQQPITQKASRFLHKTCEHRSAWAATKCRPKKPEGQASANSTRNPSTTMAIGIHTV